MDRRRTAFISSSTKDSVLTAFSRGLQCLDWLFVSAGGTLEFLLEHGLPVRNLADIVGELPDDDHLVLTLYPQLHRSLLAPRTPANLAKLAAVNMPPIDLLYVGLYHFDAATRDREATHVQIVEKMDVGGPAMLAAMAKGCLLDVEAPPEERRIALGDHEDLLPTLEWIRQGRPDAMRHTTRLASKAQSIAGHSLIANATYTHHYHETLWRQGLNETAA